MIATNWESVELLAKASKFVRECSRTEEGLIVVWWNWRRLTYADPGEALRAIATENAREPWTLEDVLEVD